MPPFGIELKQALGNGLGSFIRFRSGISDPTTRSKPSLVRINAESPALLGPQIAKLFKNTRVVEMSNRVAELGKDSGKLVVDLDLRGNMDTATIREVLETHQVPGVHQVALAE